jgi:hypothetical protein
MTAWQRRGALALLALLTLWAAPAGAHEMSMAEMSLRELQRGDFLWQWTATNDRSGMVGLQPQWPEGCRAEANLLHCGPGGLQGPLTIEGVGQRY